MLPLTARMWLWINPNTTTAIKMMPYSSIHTSIILAASTKPKMKISKVKVKTPPKCSILKSEDHKIMQEKLSKSIMTDTMKNLSRNNVIDRMVGYIFEKNISVYKAALDCNVVCQHNQLSGLGRSRFPESLDDQVKIGRFAKAEDKIILDNWFELVDALKITEGALVNVIFDVFLNKSPDKDLGLGRNVIGYFLSRGLGKVRLATDVFNRAKLLLSRKTGDFSPEEDSQILKFVEIHGHSNWTVLGNQMGRNRNTLVRRLELLETISMKHREGFYSLEDDQKILTQVLQRSRKGEMVKKDWEEIGKMLHRPYNSIHDHWVSVLEPWIKRHHAGTLSVDIREALINHMVEQGMEHAQDVDWNALVGLRKFAGTTPSYLQRKHQGLKHATREKFPELSAGDITSAEILRYLHITARGTRSDRTTHKEQFIAFYRDMLVMQYQ